MPDTPTPAPAPRPVSAAKRSLDYAEQELGVHTVHESAVGFRHALDGSLTRLAELKDTKRDIEVAIADLEMEVTIDEAGKHSGMSVAAMERHLKVELHKNPMLHELKTKHGAVISEIEGVEYDIRVTETDIRIAVARLTELGGYLNYLAAIKNQRS